MKCNDFHELIDSYLSDELLTETNHDVLRHLEQCANCRQFIEHRREFRGKLRSAVMNSPEFQIDTEFSENLRNTLRQSILPKKQAKNIFWTNTYSWAAVAASLIFVFTFGIWYVQSPGSNVPTSQIVSLTPKIQASYVEDVALGDHLGCAISHSLEERPVKIDLDSPQYLNLKEGVLQPLQTSATDYKLIEAHDCKYQNREFTHLIFESEGKTLSVIMTDVENPKALRTEDIVHFKSDDYQMARFDLNDKAVFVISDLPAQKNSATAELIALPMRNNFPDNQQTAIISDVVRWY